MIASFAAPYASASSLHSTLRDQGYAVLSPGSAQALCTTPRSALEGLQASWENLPPDRYLKDAGSYRKRRHSCFVVECGALRQVAHRAHWQPLDYNALHGGMHRWFEPIEPAVTTQSAWSRLLVALGGQFAASRPVARWHVEAHQFRIDTTDGIGRPTPEGAHRDGVDFVVVMLVARHAIKGGETRVFDAAGPAGVRFTLSEPWSMLLLDDARMIHETTPIQPDGDGPGHRDTLVLTYRAGGFQGDEAG